MSTRTRVGLLAAILAVAGAGCGSGSGVDTTMRLSEFAIAMEPASAKADVLTVDADNAGRLEHQLVVVKADRPVADFPLTATGEIDLTQLQVIDRAPAMGPGHYRITVPGIQPGRYYVACIVSSATEGNHFQQGMHAAFRITKNPDLNTF
jgi:hypothetical protein